MDLHAHDPSLGDRVLEDPRRELARATEAAALLAAHAGAVEANPRGALPRVDVRIVGLMEEARVAISRRRAEHVDRLIAVRGLVQRVLPPRAVLDDGVFQCLRCSALVREPQVDDVFVTEPAECYADQGGCGLASNFRLVTREERGHASAYENVQHFHLQEPPDGAERASAPETLHCVLRGPLCGEARPGERVTVNAVLALESRRANGKRTREFDFRADVVSVERERTSYEEITATPEELEEMRRLAASRDLFDRLVASFAPTIHGRADVKLALLLQLFGGVTKHAEDGSRRRGNINVILVGDPGQGKTVMMKAAARLSPRGVFTNLKNSSGVGLIGGVVKDDKDSSAYVPGPAPLAHGGVLCVDEVDKGKPEDLDVLLDPMEDGVAHITKAGLPAIEVSADAAYLLGSNPKGGRFERGAPDLAQAIAVSPPIINRCDIVLILEDEVDEATDVRTARAVIDTTIAGGARAARAAGAPRVDTGLDAEAAASAVRPPLALEFLRKYVAFAKRSVVPQITADVGARLMSKYVLIRKRKSGAADSPVPLNARQLYSLIRLAEASARARLSPVVEEDDLDRAIHVFDVGYMRAATNARGEVDGDRMGAPVSHETRDVMRHLRGLVRDMTAERGGEGVPEDDIVARAIAGGMGREAVLSTLRKMKSLAQIVPRRGGWAVTFEAPGGARP